MKPGSLAGWGSAGGALVLVVVVAVVVGRRGRARTEDQPKEAERSSTVVEVWKPMSKRWGRKRSHSNNKTKMEELEGTNE